MSGGEATGSTEHRILVGVDGSPSSMAALDWAARQAELTGSSVEVVTTWEWPISYAWTFPSPYVPSADAQEVLDQAIESTTREHPTVTFRPSLVEGHPAPVLVSESRGADLLVVGCRGHGAFAGMLIGSVSEHCVTNAHCPVLVLRGGE
jgi:nucleotide-binding universal stress UspA family protein